MANAMRTRARAAPPRRQQWCQCMHLKIPWNQPLRLLKCAATPSGSKHTETAGLGRTCSPLTSLTDRWLERQRVSTHDSPINIHGHGNSVLTFTVKSQHEWIHCHPLTRGHACYIQGCRFPSACGTRLGRSSRGDGRHTRAIECRAQRSTIALRGKRRRVRLSVYSSYARYVHGFARESNI